MPPKPTTASSCSRPGRGQRGITLLECIAAIAILGTSMLAGLSMYSMKIEITATEHANWQAQRFLTREMEKVQGMEFEHIMSMPSAPIAEDPNYHLRRDVVVVDAVTKNVSVTVEWTGPTGTACSESLDTVRCEGVK